MWGSGPPSNARFLGSRQLCPSQTAFSSVLPFFAGSPVCQTHRPPHDVCSNRPHLTCHVCYCYYTVHHATFVAIGRILCYTMRPNGLLSLPNSSVHLVLGRVLPTLQIGTKFNRSSTRVKEMDTVHPIYLILTICAPQ